MTASKRTVWQASQLAAANLNKNFTKRTRNISESKPKISLTLRVKFTPLKPPKTATITSRNQTEFDATLKPKSKFIKIHSPNSPSREPSRLVKFIKNLTDATKSNFVYFQAKFILKFYLKALLYEFSISSEHPSSLIAACAKFGFRSSSLP